VLYAVTDEFEYFAVNFTVTIKCGRPPTMPEENTRIGVRSQKSLKTAVLDDYVDTRSPTLPGSYAPAAQN